MKLQLATRQIGIILIIVCILSIPLIAMQFTDEVNWSSEDFIFASILLSIIGLTIEMSIQLAKNKLIKSLLIGIILIIGFLIWIELAVGIFGSPFAGN